MGRPTQSSPFGRGLRQWRRLRGVSQLELAITAATTTRHVSYLENGRSRPSRQMVERLGDALRIPLRERNRLLEMAGLAPTYPEGDLTADDLAPFGRAIDRLLTAHDPYPGFVVDRHWNIVDTNAGTDRFLGDTGVRNTVRLVLGEWQDRIDNWEEVAVALRDRIATDLLRFPEDEHLLALHAEVGEALDRAGSGRVATTSDRPAGRVICPRFHLDGMLIRTITVAARFESAADVTLDEVRVELIYPEDDVADRFFRHLATSG